MVYIERVRIREREGAGKRGERRGGKRIWKRGVDRG